MIGKIALVMLVATGMRCQHPRARNDYDEETAYESYMNPEPGFQSGPGDSTNAD